MKANILLVFLLGNILYLIGCCNTQFVGERSIDELSQAGFYVYVFPDAYEIQSDWRRVVKLSSFNKQCSGFFSEDTWNPIYVTYSNGSDSAFEIRISPQDAIWDMSKTTKIISLDVDWIPTNQGEYYLTETNQINIKAKDIFGMDIIFTSNLSADTLAELIKRLEYKGPSLTTVNDPWQAACGN